MPQDKYFDKFPKITYNGAEAIDITKRVVVTETATQNPYLYYPFEITEQERPDQFANRYYDDPFKSWVVYVTNNIVDPHHEWYYSENDFYNMLQTKYGSTTTVLRKIKYYRNDWSGQKEIAVSDYNTLTPRLRSEEHTSELQSH